MDMKGQAKAKKPKLLVKNPLLDFEKDVTDPHHVSNSRMIDYETTAASEYIKLLDSARD